MTFLKKEEMQAFWLSPFPAITGSCRSLDLSAGSYKSLGLIWSYRLLGLADHRQASTLQLWTGSGSKVVYHLSA